MADVQTASLYDQDFHQWALDQARAVRELRDAAARPGAAQAVRRALDWDNLIEEVEGLAKGVRSEPRSHLLTIVQHLVKLELSTAVDPRHSWEETVQRSRLEVEILLDDNPSLRREVPALLIAPVMAKAAKAAVDDLVRRGEVPADTSIPSYTQAQVTEDWWPGQNGAAA
jgi:hypothetical protein